MNEFYTNVRTSGNKILYRAIRDGKPVFEEIAYQPRLFVPTKNESIWHTLQGEPVEPIEPGSIKDCKEFLKQYEGVEAFKIYGNNDWSTQCIAAAADGAEIEYDLSQMTIAVLDIETECETAFSPAEDATERINAITVRVKNERWVFGLGKFSEPFTDVDSSLKTNCHCYEDEAEMLQDFVELWVRLKPDILTGWNVRFYDIPYLVNRIKDILGERQMKRLSPWKQIRTKTINKWGKDYTVYELLGTSTLDFYELFKKYTYENQESWSLGHIAWKVLAEKKLSYAEYDGIASFYRENFQKFIEYNIHDVDLVFRMDEKLRLIELHVSLAYLAKINFEEAFSQVRTWDALIYNHLRDRNIVIPQKESKSKSEQYAGAYVKEPITGAHDWIVSFDLNSLYPHLIMQYNISPETMVPEEDIPSELMELWGVPLVDRLLTKSIDTQHAKRHNLCLAANGQFFVQDRRGFLPILMEKMYNDRKVSKNIMINARQKIEKLKERQEKGEDVEAEIKELSILATRSSTREQGLKICLNSAYGALGNQYFRFFDIRQAEAITLGGQLSIRWIENALNEFLNEILDTEDYAYIVASDTDSVYIRMGKAVEKWCSGKDVEATVRFLDKACDKILTPFIEKKYEELAEYINAYEQKMVMGREVIADRGVWTAKKRYILNVHNSEGVQYAEPKLKIMGIETTRSSTPQVVRDELKNAIRIVMQGTNDELIEFVETFKETFMGLEPELIAFPRGVNNLDKYHDPVRIYKKSCPIAVKGSLIFNKMLKRFDLLREYRAIVEGDKIKFVYLKVPNKMGDRVVSFPNAIPKEFGIHDHVDYELHFEKAFLDPLQTILNSVGWSALSVATLEDYFV